MHCYVNVHKLPSAYFTLKRFCAALFQLYNVLQKAKPWRQYKGPQSPAMGAEEETNRQSPAGVRAMKTLRVTLKRQIHDIIRVSEPTRCPTPRTSPSVNTGLRWWWGTNAGSSTVTMHQPCQGCWWGGGAVCVCRAGGPRETSCFPRTLAVTLKLP